VKPMTVRAACYERGITQLFNFPVITLIIGLSGDEEDFVPFHHLPIAVAFLADLGMEFLSKGHYFGFIPFQHGNFMKAVTVGTSGGIWIPCKDGLAMDALLIPVIGVTGRACLDHSDLVPFPGGQFVDLPMTILALDIVDEMGTGVMLCGLFLVTPMAGDGFCVDLGPFGLGMNFDVRNVPMAAITRERSMDRLRKLSLNDLVPVTSEAFGIIDAFGAIFPPLNFEFFSFLWQFSLRSDRRGLTEFFSPGSPERGSGQQE
jgi:hypothetical protein